MRGLSSTESCSDKNRGNTINMVSASGQTNQGNRRVNPKIDLSIYHNLICDKGSISILWERMVYLINSAGVTGYSSRTK